MNRRLSQNTPNSRAKDDANGLTACTKVASKERTYGNITVPNIATCIGRLLEDVDEAYNTAYARVTVLSRCRKGSRSQKNTRDSVSNRCIAIHVLDIQPLTVEVVHPLSLIHI